MRAAVFLGVSTSLAMLLTGCAPDTPPAAAPQPAAADTQPVAPQPIAPIANNRQIMLGLVIPAADVIWGVANEAPADDAAWEKVAANAVMIAEAGNLMMTGPRRVDDAQWSQFAKAMIDGGKAAAQGAMNKNVDQVAEAGNTLYEACDGCHQKYMAARQTPAQ